jgi:hypothetical protein
MADALLVDRRETTTHRLPAILRQPAVRRVSAFLAVGLLFGMVLQSALLHGLKTFGRGNVGVMNKVMRGEIDADLLISGSSRAMYHYDPRIVESRTGLKSFNIGRDGTKLQEQLTLLQLYLARYKAPRYLIQNLDLASFRENAGVTDAKQYVAWLDNEDVYSSLISERRYFLLCRLVPLVGITYTGGGPAAIEGLLPGASTERQQFVGYEPQRRTWNEDFERIRRQNPNGLTWTIDPAKTRTLERLVDVARRNGIVTILVLSPDYRRTQDFYRNRREIVETFRSISRTAGVRFWDYTVDPIADEKAYFYNSQHLNDRGAAAFSEAVGNRFASEVLGHNRRDEDQ